MTTNQTSTRLLDRPEGRIGYDVIGDGPLVVCLPGMGELRSSYRFTVPALTAGGFRVATMDLRGHGDSDATFSAYDDVAAGGTRWRWSSISVAPRSWSATPWPPARRCGRRPSVPTWWPASR